MCGIFGYVRVDKFNGSKFAMTDFIEQAFPTSILRGVDGSGMFVANYSDDFVSYYKRAIPGHDFIKLSTTKKLLSERTDLVAGHVRASTRGAVNDNNSHPFYHKNDILIHNGTLRNEHRLDASDFKVDSDALVQHISKHGIEKALTEDVEGAFAIAHYNVTDRVFNLIRNDQRELAVAWLEKGDGLLFASELNYLKWLIGRNTSLSNIVEKIEELTPGMLVSVSKDIRVKELKLKKYPVTVGFINNHNHGVVYNNNNNNSNRGSRNLGKRPKIGEVVIGAIEIGIGNVPSPRRSITDEGVVRFNCLGDHNDHIVNVFLEPGSEFSQFFEDNPSKYNFMDADFRNNLYLIRVDDDDKGSLTSYYVEKIPKEVTSYTKLSPRSSISEVLNTSFCKEFIEAHDFTDFVYNDTDDTDKNTNNVIEITDINSLPGGQLVRDAYGRTTKLRKIRDQLNAGCCYCTQPFTKDDILNEGYMWYNGEPIHSNCSVVMMQEFSGMNDDLF